MRLEKERALQAIEEHKELLCAMSDAIWDHPETGFHEHFAADLFCRTLEEQGFRVERDLAGIATDFSGTYGQDGPVIAFLGEFDASGLYGKAGYAGGWTGPRLWTQSAGGWLTGRRHRSKTVFAG